MEKETILEVKKHAGGRPRKYDLIQEAKDLDDWSKKDNSYSLYEFTHSKDYLASELSYFAKESIEFSKSLQKAKERISINREKGVHQNIFNYGIWNRNARVYDNLLKSSEDQDAKDEIDRKKSLMEYESKLKDENSAVSTEMMEKMESFMRFLTTLKPVDHSSEVNINSTIVSK